jgi:hypothetical protein
VEAGKGGKIAFLWEGNDPGVDDKLTYKELLERVCQVPTYPCIIASCIMFQLVDSAKLMLINQFFKDGFALNY